MYSNKPATMEIIDGHLQAQLITVGEAAPTTVNADATRSYASTIGLSGYHISVDDHRGGGVDLAWCSDTAVQHYVDANIVPSLDLTHRSLALLTKSVSSSISSTCSLPRSATVNYSGTVSTSKTASLNATKSSTVSSTLTTTPQTQEPMSETDTPPPIRTPNVSLSVVIPDNGDATMTTAAGSTVVTSTFAGTGTVSSVARVSASLRVLDCPLSEDDPQPSFFEMPIQFSVGGRMGVFAGACIGCSGLVAVAVFTCWMWASCGQAAERGHSEDETGPFLW